VSEQAGVDKQQQGWVLGCERTGCWSGGREGKGRVSADAPARGVVAVRALSGDHRSRICFDHLRYKHTCALSPFESRWKVWLMFTSPHSISLV